MSWLTLIFVIAPALLLSSRSNGTLFSVKQPILKLLQPPISKNVIFLLMVITSPAWILSCDQKKNEKSVVLNGTALVWTKPANFPDPVYNLSKNPLTKEGVYLGRTLFYDPVLSKNNNVSCGSCHQQKAAFSHQGQAFSQGVHRELSKRNSPSIQNMAWNRVFFWDGGVHDLDFVPFNPVQNPVEMGENVGNVIVKLKRDAAKNLSDYPRLFQAAFGTKEITTERMMKALSQFMVTMVTADSRYDKYVSGDENAISEEEKEGLLIFKNKCFVCHSGMLFTDNAFKNNGLSPLKNNDLGRYDVTRLDSDRYKFKVPGLRNVSVSAPYMHDGRFKTLKEVLDHYSNGVVKSKNLDPLLINEKGQTGISLTNDEKKKILAFLESLTDEKFLSDTTFADPHVSVVSVK